MNSAVQPPRSRTQSFEARRRTGYTHFSGEHLAGVAECLVSATKTLRTLKRQAIAPFMI
jgi:hypothetical protein